MLTAYYDLRRSPPTYDFASFLLMAEAERIGRGLDGLQVKVLPGPAGGFREDKLPPFTVAERETMRDGIVAPMASLLPSCAGVEVCKSRVEPEGESFGHGRAVYGLRHMLKAFGNGLFPLVAPAPVERKSYVTITLREAGYWPSRNSQLSEWLKVAKWLTARGVEVIFVRDAAKASDPLEYETCPVASLGLIERANLYAGARLNLFINNGPAWVCLALGLPALITRMISPDAPAVSAEFFASNGLEPGSQIRGLKKDQRISWGDDDAATVIEAVEEMGFSWPSVSTTSRRGATKPQA